MKSDPRKKEASYFIDEDRVVWRQIDHEIVVLSLDSGHYYYLNHSGALIWQYLQEKNSFKQMIRKLMRRYKISYQKARDDIIDLIEDLESESLIRTLSGSSR